jgi:predicted transposase YbfD/YdcC
MEKCIYVSTLIKIESSREIKGVPHRETRYHISDETLSGPSYYLSLARGHRGIENQPHRHPDVTFREDACRARQGDAPLNLSTLRKFALRLLSNQKTNSA